MDYFSNVERFLKRKYRASWRAKRACPRKSAQNLEVFAVVPRFSGHNFAPSGANSDRYLLSFAGNVDLETRGNAMNQLGGHFVLAHDFDRLGQFDASLIDFKPLRRQRFRDIGCGNRAE